MSDAMQGAEPSVVGPYLATVLGRPEWHDCRVTLIAGGRSNLTYLVQAAGQELILRRPPLGHVLPTAHDMTREFRVISALQETAVPVPRAVHLCTDAAVLGQPFYVMSRVMGLICSTSLPAGFAEKAAERRAVAEGLVDVLVALHEVRAGEVGLADFGRPEGFLARQVARWGKQWDATRLAGHDDVDRLGAELAAQLPVSQRSAVVHGDFRLDNCLLDPHRPGRVNAVLDWEMSTLGDPLADLGMLLVYWSEAGDASTRQGAQVVPSITALPGFPTRAEVAERYAERSGADVARLPWYVAFAFFKLAVVCAGIVARVQAGVMLGEGFDGFAERVAPLAGLGRSTLASGTVS